MSSKKSRRDVLPATDRSNKLVALVVSLAPFALLIWFVAAFSVNVPYMDQWYLALLFKRVSTGASTFSDFFVQNNEHRLFFPKLIWTGLAFATNWNTQCEMLVSLILALITFLTIYYVADKQKGGEDKALFHLSAFLTSLLVFSLIQYENWLWGFQIGFILVQTCVALAISFATSSSLSPHCRFILAAFFCFVASFSAAHGLFSWLALIPLVSLIFYGRRKKVKIIAVWMVLFFISAAIYSYDFHRQAGGIMPDMFFPLKHPKEGTLFFLSLLGSQFAQGFTVSPLVLAPLMGAALLTVFLSCVFYLIFKNSFTEAAPWLSLGLFGLSFVLLTTIGRAAWGVGSAVGMSRYTTAPVFVAVGVIQMCRLASRVNSWWHTTFLIAVGCLSILILVNSLYAVAQASQIKTQRARAKSFIEIIPYIDQTTDRLKNGCLFPLYPHGDAGAIVRKNVELLDQIGFQHIITDAKFIDNSDFHFGSFDLIATDSGGPLVKKGDSAVKASGWAALPDVGKLPDLIMISYDDNKFFVTGAPPGTGSDRSDVVKLFGSDIYAKAGWVINIPAELLPEREIVLKAWAYDADRKRFIKLSDYNGEKRVRVEN